jgi:hypothetical protein
MACYCNLVLVNIKLKAPKLAQFNANKAVELDPNNAKVCVRACVPACVCRAAAANS